MEINTINIENELDLMVASKRTLLIGDLCGMSTAEQTNLATAISEICRNCIEYAKKGQLRYRIAEFPGFMMLEAQVTDGGPGIDNIQNILQRMESGADVKGMGIVRARRLTDHFDIQTGKTGTKVTLGKKLPKNHPQVNKAIIKEWKKLIESTVSPYEMIKEKNMELIRISEEITAQNCTMHEQLKEIQKLNRHLKIANGNLEDFAYAVSHDLQAPLSNVKLGFSLLEKARTSEEHRQLMNNIRDSISRFENTLHSVVELIDIKKDDELPAQSIDIRDFMDCLKKEFRKDLEMVKGKIITDIEPGLKFVFIESYLRIILSNLLSNSVKYCSAKRKLVICINAYRVNEYVAITVKDNGIGMDLPKVKDRLFKPFYRINRQNDGRGIGLFLVKNIIDKTDSKIEVESNPDEGTTFLMYLKEEPGIVAEAQKESATNGESGTNGEKGTGGR